MFPRCFRYVAFLMATVSLASDETLPYTSWSGSNASRVLRMLLDEKNYDKRLRPNFEGKPLAVLVTVFITSLGGLDEREMQFQSTFFMRELWTDPRLAFGKYYSTRNLTLNGEIMDQIWIPDTYINNEKSITASKHEFLLKMFPDGKVLYSQRVTVTAACKMDLRNFPMDYQNCSLLFESYSMTTKDLYFSWDNGGTGDPKNAVTVGEELIMSQFALDDYSVDEITAGYVTGTYALLKLTFHLRRKKFYYVVSIYIPTILITILSWVSFWIPRNSPPARVALGITTVLALTTLIFGIQSSMPKVSYVKAIDWFLCVSFLYVFAALVEYPSSTFVKSQAQKLTRKGTDILRKVKGIKNDLEDFPFSSGAKYGSTDKPRDNQFDLRKLPRHRNGENNACPDQNALENNMEGFKDQNDAWGKRQYPEEGEGDFIDNFRDNKMLNVVDKYARIGFPVSYFLFNVCYWIIYLTAK